MILMRFQRETRIAIIKPKSLWHGIIKEFSRDLRWKEYYNFKQQLCIKPCGFLVDLYVVDLGTTTLVAWKRTYSWNLRRIKWRKRVVRMSTSLKRILHNLTESLTFHQLLPFTTVVMFFQVFVCPWREVYTRKADTPRQAFPWADPPPPLPEMATAVDAMPPTGMHSCWFFFRFLLYIPYANAWTTTQNLPKSFTVWVDRMKFIMHVQDLHWNVRDSKIIVKDSLIFAKFSFSSFNSSWKFNCS